MAFWNGQYYFAGVFQVLGSRKIVAFDGVDQWSPLGGGVGGNFLRKVQGYGDSLYVGGFMLPGQDVVDRHLQIWDGENWLPIFEEVFVSGQVMGMAVYDGELYISGAFFFGEDTTQYGLIRYDGHRICALGGFMYHGGGEIAFFQDKLYMALPPQNGQLSYEYIGYLDLATVVPDTCVTVSHTGVQEHAAQGGVLRVYPNPVVPGDAVTLCYAMPTGFSPSGPLRVVVQDAMGRQVHEEVLGHYGHSELRGTKQEGVLIAVSASLAAGLYHLHLTDGTRWLAGGKVVVE